MPKKLPFPPVLAVLGTSGKTSSLLLTRFILEQLGKKTAAMDTWKGPLAFARFREQSLAAASDCLLVEVPFTVLSQKQLAGPAFQAAALTNLCPVQPEAAWQLAAVSSFYGELAEGARAVFNADDRLALGIASEGDLDFITFAIDYPNAMVVAENIESSGFASRFDLAVKGEFTTLSGQVVMPGTSPAFLPAGGRHNISNSLVSACLCLLMGEELSAVAGTMARFPGIRRNLEIIYRGDFLIVDDAANDPTAVSAVLTAVTGIAWRRLIVLHGMAGGAGVLLNSRLASELAAWIRKGHIHNLILTRSMYHCPVRHRVLVAEEKACLGRLREEGVDFSYFPDLSDALESALWQAEPGDLVLLLGGPVLNRAAGLLAGLLAVDAPNKALVPSQLQSRASSPPTGQAAWASPS